MTVDEINAKILDLGRFSDVDVFKVGKSLFGRDILGLHIGSYAGNQIMLTGAIHAREYITSLLLIQMVEYLRMQNFDGGFYFVPLVNPDGVSLVLDGVQSVPCDIFRKYLLSVNEEREDFSQWKANGEAVDLNVNFNALWGEGTQNVRCPAPGNFIGFYPESEREVRDLIAFTTKNYPAMTIDYHTKGEVIYYGFESQSSEELAKNLKIANNIAEYTGYQVLRSEGSVGGYQDFSINSLHIPSVTIEVGSADISHPISEVYLQEIFERNKDVPLVALNSINNMQKAGRVNGKRLWKGLCLRH